MGDWCMEHPVMTFVLLLVTVVFIGDSVQMAIRRRKGDK